MVLNVFAASLDNSCKIYYMHSYTRDGSECALCCGL